MFKRIWHVMFCRKRVIYFLWHGGPNKPTGIKCGDCGYERSI